MGLRTSCVETLLPSCTECVDCAAVNLPEYIAQMGDAKAAKLFGVSERTVMSWRLRDRIPRPTQAKNIVSKSPVTMDGIYSSGIKPVRLTKEAA